MHSGSNIYVEVIPVLSKVCVLESWTIDNSEHDALRERVEKSMVHSNLFDLKINSAKTILALIHKTSNELDQR